MNCKERLTIKYDGAFVPKELCTIDRNGDADDCDGCEDVCDNIYDDCEGCPIQKCFDRLGELEDKLENGTLIELPCKVGDTVYNIYWWKDVQKKCKGKDGKTYYRTERQHYVQKSTFDLFDYRNFGKRVFLTKEEAEARLKELQNGN